MFFLHGFSQKNNEFFLEAQSIADDHRWHVQNVGVFGEPSCPKMFKAISRHTDLDLEESSIFGFIQIFFTKYELWGEA